ncbi:MAG TPA: helix-turn-helix domain-containing protein [Iamia sp.]|nr:helix-turn-helix domain-containing protein [Iamia sp.]
MPRERAPATTQQAKALSNPMRLRILRLCQEREWSNAQLAQRLMCDPSTLLYHARILVAAGFLEQGEPRRGARGATEKPYRATGRSWDLDISGAESVSSALLRAFLAEMREAGPTSLEQASRFVLHLDEDERRTFRRRLQQVLDEYEDTDAERRAQGHPPIGGLLVLHRVRPDPEEPEDRPPT